MLSGWQGARPDLCQAADPMFSNAQQRASVKLLPLVVAFIAGFVITLLTFVVWDPKAATVSSSLYFTAVQGPARVRLPVLRANPQPSTSLDISGSLNSLPQTPPQIRRRDALLAPTAAATAFGLLLPQRGVAAPVPRDYSLLWAADSLQSTDFDPENYAAMRDDEDRTSKFEKAIARRLAHKPNEMVVLDVGTGPFALLAIAAAKAGAKKVYAVEATPEVAELARNEIRKQGIPDGVIEVLEGYSTEVELPEKVDLLVGEIIGSVATEESVYSTIRDAQARFMKDPYNAASYIPQRVQTLIAPVSWPFHYMVAAEGRKAAGLVDEEGPIRLNCNEETVALMADAQIMEDFRYDSPNLPGASWELAKPLTFEVSGARLKENTEAYGKSLGFDGPDVNNIARDVASGWSGLAMWPRLILDESIPGDEFVVEARGKRGAPQKSHWQTVLALMPPRPLPLQEGTAITVEARADFKGTVDPAVYELISHVSAA